MQSHPTIAVIVIAVLIKQLQKIKVLAVIIFVDAEKKEVHACNDFGEDGMVPTVLQTSRMQPK